MSNARIAIRRRRSGARASPESNSKIMKGRKKELRLVAICVALHHPDDLSLWGGGFGSSKGEATSRRRMGCGQFTVTTCATNRSRWGWLTRQGAGETKGVPTAGSPGGKGESKQKHTAKIEDCVKRWWKQRPAEEELTTTNCGGGEKKREGSEVGGGGGDA